MNETTQADLAEEGRVFNAQSQKKTTTLDHRPTDPAFPLPNLCM